MFPLFYPALRLMLLWKRQMPVSKPLSALLRVFLFQDMVVAKEYIKDKNCRLVGPNCPGVITADEAKVHHARVYF